MPGCHPVAGGIDGFRMPCVRDIAEVDRGCCARPSRRPGGRRRHPRPRTDTMKLDAATVPLNLAHLSEMATPPLELAEAGSV